MKYLVQFYYEMRYLFRINILFLIFLLVGISQVFAQEVKTTSSSNQKSTIYDQMQVQSDSLLETPTQFGDIQVDELEAYDPTSIPLSVDLSEANWIFEVPVSVKNISPVIKRMVILMVVTYGDHISGYNLGLGRAKAYIDLVNGAYEGTVTIGVPFDKNFIELAGVNPNNYEPGQAEMYNCYLMIQDPDTGDLWTPASVQCSPVYRMADPNKPFHSQVFGDIPKTFGSGN